MADGVDQWQASVTRTLIGTWQISGRRWHWIWEHKAGRERLFRACIVSAAAYSGAALGIHWPTFGGCEILALLAWGYAKAELAEPEAEPDAEVEPEPEREMSDAEFILTLVLDAMGDAPGIHLDNLLAHLRQQPDCAAMTRDTMRTALDLAGCSVRRALRVGVRTGIAGVHRDDATAALDRVYDDPTPLPPPGAAPDL